MAARTEGCSGCMGLFLGCGTAYTVKGPTARWMWRGMMLRRSATRAVRRSP